VFGILVGDWGILTALVITLVALLRFYRSTMEVMLLDRAPFYRLISRLSVGAVAAFMIWVTMFDNWRQILGVLTRYTHDERRSQQSDPFFAAQPDELVRYVSYALVVASVLGTAYLFARYARGYWGPLVATPLAVALYYIFNAFRLRFDVDSVRIADRSITGVWEIASTLVWIGGLWATFVLLICCAFIMLWGPVALVLSILYRTTIGKVEYQEPEMFRIMRERNESRRHATEHGRHTRL
jgi:ABC-type nickel/cobalt efflux system permease component RcnA